MQVYYFVSFLLSLLLSGIYLIIWRKHFDVHLTLVFALVPITNLAFLLQKQAQTTDAALVATRFTYVGGCFLQLIIMLTVFHFCGIRLRSWLRIAILLLCSAVFLSVQTIGRSPLFYTRAALEQVGGKTVFVKEYGVMHTVFYIMNALFFSVSVAAIVYTLLRKSQASRKILLLLLFPDILCFASFFGGRLVVPGIELIPAAYIVAQVCYICIAFRLSLYNVSDMVAQAMAQTNDSCFIIFDPHLNYLGSNETARRLLPQLNNLVIDLPLDRSRAMQDKLLPWLMQYRDHPEDAEANRHFETFGGKIYLFSVASITVRNRLKGYEIIGVDDTLDRSSINALTYTKEDLERKVAEKTAHIEAMHNNLVMGMATMVESRDNSTGGHIRRTSEGVRILLDAVRETGAFAPDEVFCRNLIKAAPMHDLGKIAVDDRILRKPGRFEPEEFEIMKTHAAEGARIVHEILKETDDLDFHLLAENVAHYHHERWDGSGYPAGLKGEEIPLEARIMAVADVYDALVSKRVYKDKMSFEKANAIILEGMGSQFDPSLEPVYRAARPRLEAYYASLES